MIDFFKIVYVLVCSFSHPSFFLTLPLYNLSYHIFSYTPSQRTSVSYFYSFLNSHSNLHIFTILIITFRLSGTYVDPRSPACIGYSAQQCSPRRHTRSNCCYLRILVANSCLSSHKFRSIFHDEKVRVI